MKNTVRAMMILLVKALILVVAAATSTTTTTTSTPVTSTTDIPGTTTVTTATTFETTEVQTSTTSQTAAVTTESTLSTESLSTVDINGTTVTGNDSTVAGNGTTVASYSILTAPMQILCPEPHTIIGGAVISKGPYFANISSVVYTCFSGFSMSGPAQVLCSTNGTWNTNGTQCVPIDNKPKVDTKVTINQPIQAMPFWLMVALCVVFGLLGLLLLTCIFAFCAKTFGCFKRPCCQRRQDTPESFIVDDYESPTPVSSRPPETHRKKAVKPKDKWMPHSNQVRTINTSTQ
ncbi:uncharacterized protein LOC128216244 [Mya arenaria]|uniref:uncharacterized protein LOC128216244 n=1 Tax=Mya arenaria TaxID=6604 RepID=UPI0022DECB4F|nr:uncharacterized protein LOC128216244 [Mya arenaria]